jgi:hypothetical protein
VILTPDHEFNFWPTIGKESQLARRVLYFPVARCACSDRRRKLRFTSFLPKIMHCLTSSEIHKWLTGQGMHHQPLDCGVPIAGDFNLPAERRARLHLAGYLADLLSKDGNKLVEILPMPQPQDDEWEQIANFRSSLDDHRPLLTSPGHLFKSRDRNEFRSMLTMLLGFQSPWSFYIYSAPSHTTLLVGERMEIWSPKKGLRNELGRHLAPQRAA